MSEIDLGHLRQWVDTTRTVHETLSLFPAKALASLLEHSTDAALVDELPLCWHWLYFLDTPGASVTGPDGHPKLGGFLPPVPLQQRMWAASDMENLHPIKLAQAAERTTTVQSVELKSGKTGQLAFVTLQHVLSQRGTPCVREQQTLVYRDIANSAKALLGEPAPTDADWSRTVHPDAILLFRYSALTYNSHRIHYDRVYALEQECYPGLVVQAPLLATLLLDLLRRHLPRSRVMAFRFRVLRPTFDTARFTLGGKRHGDAVNLWTADHDGRLGMSAVARLA